MECIDQKKPYTLENGEKHIPIIYSGRSKLQRKTPPGILGGVANTGNGKLGGLEHAEGTLQLRNGLLSVNVEVFSILHDYGGEFLGM